MKKILEIESKDFFRKEQNKKLLERMFRFLPIEDKFNALKVNKAFHEVKEVKVSI